MIGLGNVKGMTSSPIVGSHFLPYFEKGSSMLAHHLETNLFMSIVGMQDLVTILVQFKDTHSHMLNGYWSISIIHLHFGKREARFAAYKLKILIFSYLENGSIIMPALSYHTGLDSL